MSGILEVRDVEVTFEVGPLMRRRSILGVAGVSFDLHGRRNIRDRGRERIGKDHSGTRDQRASGHFRRIDPVRRRTHRHARWTSDETLAAAHVDDVPGSRRLAQPHA